MTFQVIYQVLSDLLFGVPGTCALCGGVLSSPDDISRGICGLCYEEMKEQVSWVCRTCGMPIKPPLEYCSACRKNLYYFDAQRSCGVYEGNLRKAIIRFKHQGERWLALPLGRLLAEKSMEFGEVDIVVPVPVDPSRWYHRGFNQARDLAKVVSEVTGKRHLDLLTRAESSFHQSSLGRRKRWENLRGLMGAKKKMDLGGVTALIVDDVVTSGATLDESARVLKELGASRVYGVSCARTVTW